MYLWIAADVSKALQPLRQAAQLHNPGLDETAFSLPQHISLKISFWVDNSQFEQAVDRVTDLLITQEPLIVGFKGLEIYNGILWLRADRSLLPLHHALDKLFFEEFNVVPHPFDKDFIFHSTLFMDGPTDKLQAVAKQLSDFPKCAAITEYIIGCSNDNTPGSYRVIKNVVCGPNRKRNRAEGYDYATPGCYFITICTANRQKLFWNDTKLSVIGKIVDREIIKLSTVYENVCVDKYAVMPDHLHLLVSITSEGAPSIPRIMQQFKGSITKQVGRPIWQKSYYDHGIRNQQDYDETWTYIENNPKKYLLRNE